MSKKKSESQTGVKPMTFQTSGRHSIHWALRTHEEQGHLIEFVRHAARISIVIDMSKIEC